MLFYCSCKAIPLVNQELLVQSGHLEGIFHWGPVSVFHLLLIGRKTIAPPPAHKYLISKYQKKWPILCKKIMVSVNVLMHLSISLCALTRDKHLPVILAMMTFTEIFEGLLRSEKHHLGSYSKLCWGMTGYIQIQCFFLQNIDSVKDKERKTVFLSLSLTESILSIF